MKLRKAILTGGGRATRLHPITITTNKHLLPLANKPVIFHAIEKVVHAGIDQIFINVNPGETALQEHIGDGGHWGVDIKYFEQTGGPQGIAHVVNEAKKFIGDDPFLFYLSDNVIVDQITPLVEEFSKGHHDCMLTLCEVPDPERFGVPVFKENSNELADVLEKPENPPNNYAVTGIYLYGPKIFFDAYNRIQPSHRGEYEISDIHSLFLKEGKKVGYKEITGMWKDTGKPQELLLTNRSLMDVADNSIFHYNRDKFNHARIIGKVKVGIGTIIGRNVTIEGPVIIGENCQLENCHIGPYVTIGQGTIIKDARIENSIILDNCHIECDEHIADSIIGKNVNYIKKSSDKKKRLLLGDKTNIEM